MATTNYNRDWHQTQADLEMRRLEQKMKIQDMYQKLSDQAITTGPYTTPISPWAVHSAATPVQPKVHEDWTKNYKEINDLDEIVALLKMGITLRLFPEAINIRKDMPTLNKHLGTSVEYVPAFLLKKIVAKELGEQTVLVEVE